MLIKHIYIIIITSCIVFNLYSQPEFKYYGMNDGFSDISFTDILQDRKGFLWFATTNGLNRFDGKNVKIYKSEPGNPYSLSYNRIAAIYEDSYGYIWIYTYDKDFHRLNPETERIINMNDILEEKTGKRMPVFSYYESSPGVVWLISKKDGISRVIEKNSVNSDFQIDLFNNTNILPANTVRFVHKDNNGCLWISTTNGLIQFENDTFSINTTGYKLYENKEQFNVITEIKNKLWLGTRNNGLFYYSLEDKKLYAWEKYSISNPVTAIIQGNSDDLLVTTSGDGLFYLTRDGDQYDHLNPGEKRNNIVEPEYNGKYKDLYGKFWMVGQKRGITMFDPENKNITYFGLTPEIRESAGESDNPFFLEDSNGNMWVAIYGGGLCKLNRGDMKFNQYLNHPNYPHSLSSNMVLEIYEDNSSNLWIGTYQGGLNKLELKIYPFKFVKPIKNPLFQSFNEVRAIMVDKYDRTWLGTKEGHIYCYDQEEGLIFNFPDDLGLQSRYIISNVYELREDHIGNLWIGTKGHGLYVIKEILTSEIIKDHYHIENYRYTSRGSEPDIISYNDIYAICQDHFGQLWIGTYNGGLSLIEDINNVSFKWFISKPEDPGSISDNKVRFIMQDSKNNLWICTTNGLNLLESKYLKTNKKKFIRFEGSTEDKKNLAYKDVICVFEDSKNRIWAGTYGGGLNLLHYDTLNKTYYFEVFKKEQGISGEVILGIEEDNKGNLWLGTDNGLYKFNYEYGKIENYVKEEGIGDNLFSEGASDFNSLGKLVFGQKNGFVSFFPDSVKKDTVSYNVLITGLKVLGEKVKPTIEGSPLVKCIESTKEITLRYDQNFIEIQFVILDLMSSERCQYRYFLEGVDKNWVSSGNNQIATYTDIDPGNYIFHVQAANHNGYWSKQEATLIINIDPPYYKTWWFRIIVLLFIIGSLIGYYFYRLTSLKKQQKYLEKLVKERTFEVEEKNRILLQQAEELNQINTVLEERQNYIEEQSEELKAQKEKLEVINLSLNETNTLLEERQQQVQEQAEELKVQAEDLSLKNQDLKKLNATKDKLFSIIAHDLKNPFNSILGFCKIILTKYDTMNKDKVKHLVEIIYNSTKGIYGLLENLLQWSRTQIGSIIFLPEKLDLSEIILENIMIVKNMAEQKNISISTNIPKYLYVKADRNMLNTIIRNLLTNSIKFTENGKIDVFTKQNEKIITVEISDTGIGLSKEKIEKIFQVEKSKSTEGTRGEQGSGLGLIICKEFAEKNGGKIFVRSEEGKGSTFGFTLQVFIE